MEVGTLAHHPVEGQRDVSVQVCVVEDCADELPVLPRLALFLKALRKRTLLLKTLLTLNP